MRAHLYLCAFTCTSMLSLCISARAPACARNPRAVQAHTHTHTCAQPPPGVPWEPPAPLLGRSALRMRPRALGFWLRSQRGLLFFQIYISPSSYSPSAIYIFFLFLPRELPFVALVPSRSVKGAGFEVSPPLPEEVFATLCRSCWHFALRSRLCGCSCDGASSQRLRAAPPAPQPSPHVAPTQHGATCTDSG